MPDGYFEQPRNMIRKVSEVFEIQVMAGIEAKRMLHSTVGSADIRGDRLFFVSRITFSISLRIEFDPVGACSGRPFNHFHDRVYEDGCSYARLFKEGDHSGKVFLVGYCIPAMV